VPRRKDREFYAKIAKEKGGEMLSLTYAGCMAKYLWKCNCDHIWKATANSVQRGYWCAECSGNAKHTIEDCHKIAESRGGKCLSAKYKNNKIKMLWQCQYGHKWEACYGDIANSGHWCPDCGGSKVKTIEDCQEIATSRGGKCLSEEYVNNHTKMLWQCQYGHKWEAQYGHIRNGSWCIYCAGKAKHTIEECHELAAEHNSECLSENYINTQTNLKWRCENGHVFYSTFKRVKRGEWCPDCANDKRKKTCIERYGFHAPTLNPEIARKAARTQAASYILHHWKTGEELVCQASYEKAVVEYWNKNKTNFLWQSKTFLMPDGKSYRPDAYLPDQDLWIEVKGYFYKDAKEKWEWFQSVHPNSELWDNKKLKSLKIL
jgi:hypothetical protein